jgi:hypothetical protein
MITDYTTYDDIRAALGVESEEISDATLGLTLYSNYLDGELEDIDFTLPTVYQDTKDLLAPTDVELRFMKTCELFSTFAVAKQLCAALPLFAPRKQTDGKAAVERFDNPYRDTIKMVNEQYGTLRARLITALAAVGTSVVASVAQSYVLVSNPDYDPVTGV